MTGESGMKVVFDKDGITEVTIECHPGYEKVAQQILDDIKAGISVTIGGRG